MAYIVRFERSALRELAALPERDQKRIIKKIEALSQDPHPAGSKKLKGNDEIWRIRVGDYRVLCRIKDAELVVLVVKVAHRREVYR